MARDALTGRSRMKARRIIFRIVIIVIIGVVLGSVVYTINAKRVLHDEFPMPLGFGVSVVLTGSMEPTLKVNELVFIVKADDFKEGDIVVYQKDNQLIIHRIIMINDDMVVTQGDNNDVPDDPIPLDSLKGKLKFSIPFIGILVRAIRSVPGVIIILVLAFFLMHRSWQKEKSDGESELDAIKEQIRQLKDEVTTGEDKVEGLQAESATQADAISDLQAEIDRIKSEMAKAAAAVETASEAAKTAAEAAEAPQDASQHDTPVQA